MSSLRSCCACVRRRAGPDFGLGAMWLSVLFSACAAAGKTPPAGRRGQKNDVRLGRPGLIQALLPIRPMSVVFRAVSTTTPNMCGCFHAGRRISVYGIAISLPSRLQRQGLVGLKRPSMQTNFLFIGDLKFHDAICARPHALNIGRTGIDTSRGTGK